MLSNPMMLLMVVGGGMMFALPYITVRLLAFQNLDHHIHFTNIEKPRPGSTRRAEGATSKNVGNTECNDFWRSQVRVRQVYLYSMDIVSNIHTSFSALMSAAADSQEPEVVKPAPSAKRASAKKARR